MNIKQCTAVK